MMNDCLESSFISLSKAFCESLIHVSPQIVDASLNTIDVFSALPVFEAIKKWIDVGKSIKEQCFIEQLKCFMDECNSGRILPEKLKTFQNRINSNDCEAQNVSKRALILLDSVIDEKLSEVYAKIFVAYINQSITKDIYVELTEAVRRIFVGDIEILKSSHIAYTSDDVYKVRRLAAIGLIDSPDITVWNNANTRGFTQLGQELQKILLT